MRLGLGRAGVAGMLLSAALFIGPAVVVMLLLGELYLLYGSGRVVNNVLLGVDTVVVAMVARAALDLATPVVRNAGNAMIVLAVLLAALVVRVDPVLIMGAGFELGGVALIGPTEIAAAILALALLGRRRLPNRWRL